MTPALQSELVGAALEVKVNQHSLRLERARGSNQVLAAWGEGDDAKQLSLPARRPGGVVLPETHVEVVSDLLFHLAGFEPPRVRGSQVNDESELQRLSFRDLYWYCYLDQDSIDSSFFHLDSGAEWTKRLKSRTVLGFLLGFNQQKVAELEAELDVARRKRVSDDEAADTLEASLRAKPISTYRWSHYERKKHRSRRRSDRSGRNWRSRELISPTR